MIEIIKCPKCLQSNSLALKIVNGTYVLSCFGYPDCKHSVWLRNNVIKEATRTDTVCSKCGPGYWKIKFTLKSVCHVIGLNQQYVGDDGLTYITCIACDTALQDVLDINKQSVAKCSTVSTAGNALAGNVNNRANIQNPIFNTVPRPPASRQPLAPRQLPTDRPPVQNRQPVPNRQTAPDWQAPTNWQAPSNRQAGPSNRPQNDPRGPGSSNDANDDVKCSNCNKPARKLTVKKDGPNKGREFYACETNCNFFQWADAPPAPSRPGKLICVNFH